MARKSLPPGIQAKLAHLTGIHAQNVGALVRGKRQASPAQARKLERAAHECGLLISRLSWLYPTEYTNTYLEDGRPDETTE